VIAFSAHRLTSLKSPSLQAASEAANLQKKVQKLQKFSW